MIQNEWLVHEQLQFIEFPLDVAVCLLSMLEFDVLILKDTNLRNEAVRQVILQCSAFQL